MSPTTVHKYICVCMCVYTVYMTDNKVLQKKFILLIMHILSSFDILFFAQFLSDSLSYSPVL